MPVTGEVTPAQLETAAKLLNDICASQDDSFLVGLLEAISKNDTSGYALKHGYEVGKPTDWRAAKAMATPGPNFSLRVAGGVYRFAENYLGLSELFVNSSTQAVHVDGEPVSNLDVRNGDITFTTSHGMKFTIRFQCAQLAGDTRSDPLFKGEASSVGNDAQNTPITGAKYFPWGNSNDKAQMDNKGRVKEEIPAPGSRVSQAKILAAANIRVEAAVSSLSVCLDLVRGHSDLLPHNIAAMKAQALQMQVFGIGDVYLAGFGMLATVLTAGLAGYMREKDPDHKWEAAGGMALGVFGPQVLVVTVALVKSQILTRQATEMKSFIRQYGAKGDTSEEEGLLTSSDTVSKTVETEVNRLTTEDLKEENKVHISSIKKRVSDVYTKEVQAQVGLITYRKFRALRHLSEEEYRKIYDEETTAKFKADVSEGTVEKLINRQINQRKGSLALPSLNEKIEDLKRQKDTLKIQKDKDITEMREKIRVRILQQEKEKEIENKYKQDLKPIEEHLRKANEEENKANEEESADVEGAKKDIKREIEESRKNERDAQRESHMHGK